MKYQKLNKRRTLTLLFLTVILQNACGQGKDYHGKLVTQQQYNNISKEIKTYEYNPTYQVRFTAVSCTYEIYVNDMLATFSFTTGNTAGEQHADIPQYILNSGPQELKIIVYPKAIVDGKLANKFDSEAEISVRIVHGEYGVTNQDSFKQVVNLKVPIKVGATTAESKIAFDAVVPYTVNGWKNGTDLSKENKTELNKEVVAINEQFASAFENKDITTIASMVYNREKEIAQAFFFKSGEPNSYDKGWEKLKEEARKLESIKLAKDYDLRYFANGKVVALLQRNGENRNYPALQGETEDSYVYYGVFLYRPGPGKPLEIIR